MPLVVVVLSSVTGSTSQASGEAGFFTDSVHSAVQHHSTRLSSELPSWAGVPVKTFQRGSSESKSTRDSRAMTDPSCASMWTE